MMASSFGTLVRERRDELGISMSELARRSGLSKSYISLLERGKRTTYRGATVRKLASALSISDAELEKGLLGPLERRWAVSRPPREGSELGLFVQEARNSRELSISELAERTGLSLRLVFDIENGESPEFRYLHLALLAEAIEVDYDELRRRADAPRGEAPGTTG